MGMDTEPKWKYSITYLVGNDLHVRQLSVKFDNPTTRGGDTRGTTYSDQFRTISC